MYLHRSCCLGWGESRGYRSRNKNQGRWHTAVGSNHSDIHQYLVKKKRKRKDKTVVNICTNIYTAMQFDLWHFHLALILCFSPPHCHLISYVIRHSHICKRLTMAASWAVLLHITWRGCCSSRGKLKCSEVITAFRQQMSRSGIVCHIMQLCLEEIWS